MFGNQTPLFIPDQTSEEVLRAEEERGLTARPSLSASLCWGLWKPPAVGPQSCCLPGRELRRRKGGILLLKNWTKRMSTRREVSESWVFFHGSRVRELYSQGGVWTDCLGNGCPLGVTPWVSALPKPRAPFLPIRNPRRWEGRCYCSYWTEPDI